MIELILDFLAANAGMIGLIFFFIFFSIVGVWTFRPSAKSDHIKHSLIPLEENSNDQ